MLDALVHNLVHGKQNFKRYRCNHSFDSGRYVAGRDCRSDRSRPINRFQVGRRARSLQREVACLAAVAGKEARRFFGSGIPPMNSPAIPSERALAQQGQMLHSLLSEAVRSHVATANGADSDLPSKRPAACSARWHANKQRNGPCAQLARQGRTGGARRSEVPHDGQVQGVAWLAGGALIVFTRLATD